MTRRRAPAAFLVWGVTAVAGSLAARVEPAAGLAIALSGGIWFGLLSAMRLDARRVRVGRRRRVKGPPET